MIFYKITKDLSSNRVIKFDTSIKNNIYSSIDITKWEFVKLLYRVLSDQTNDITNFTSESFHRINNICNKLNYNISQLFHYDINHLTNIGFTDYESLKILCLKELFYSYKIESHTPYSSITNIKEVAKYLTHYFKNFTYEKLIIVTFDNSNNILEVFSIEESDFSSINVNINKLFRFLISISFSYFILCHNHCSGNPSPSVVDIRFTKDFVDKCELLNLKCKDHIIISKREFSNMSSLYPEIFRDIWLST